MKIIGILTIESMNYGNRLQNYAVQYILKELGYQPSDFRKEALSIMNFINVVKYQVRDLFRKDIYANFRKFEKKIVYNKDYINRTQININKKKYYAIIVGSDQIWNTSFDFIGKNHFLPIDHPRKISLSASFGLDAIPFDCEIASSLKDYCAISVRETSGAKIVKDFTGKDPVVLVDPTMLLTKEEWRKVEKRPVGAKEGYILTYFLSPKCENAKKKLEEIRGTRHVYELLCNDNIAGNAGPGEFIWLFNHADLILTDSFHACVFSFLFDKPFLVYDRNWNEGNMNSRLETLLSTFSIERKYVNSNMDNDIWEHNYIEGYKRLEIERKKAMNFLKKALEL